MINGDFSLFVLSVNDMLCKEGIVVLTTLSWLVAEKIKEPILYVRVWVNVRK